MKRWLKTHALPIGLVVLAVSSWLAYIMLALSETAPDWIPDILRLPTGEAGSTVLSRRGQFGDAFGAFNALVSTLALIGLLLTLRTQQDQIRSQERTSRSNDTLTRQQQFQDQLYRAVDAYRDQLQAVTCSRSGAEGPVTGRLALREIWRNQFVKHIEHVDLPLLKAAISAQMDAYDNELSGIWNSHEDVVKHSKLLVGEIESQEATRDEILRRLGSSWRIVYLANRYQLDSLYRSWYTVYRILDTAARYEIDEPTVRLYSAAFRAQISWIEMAFLLVNQIGLPSNPEFPKACRYSDKFSTFDNLDSAHDVVAEILVHVVRRTVPSSHDSKQHRLSAAAFGPAANRD